MLQRSFIHLPGIGHIKERKLWEAGVRDWLDLQGQLAKVFSDEKKKTIASRVLDQSKAAYDAKDVGFFYRSLPRDHIWRILPEFGDEVAYLDIETTGMGFPPLSHSTTISFYFRGELYQEHEFSRKRTLIEKMQRDARIWCTFFGEAFDVPFLRHEFGMALEIAHVDLCFWLKRLGYRGGLKKVQKQFAEIPARDSLDIDGFDAVRLWRMHKQGIDGALETLLTYNAEDTVVLEPLLAIAYNLEVERNPGFGLQKRNIPEVPKLRTRIVPDIYARLREGRLGVEFS